MRTQLSDAERLHLFREVRRRIHFAGEVSIRCRRNISVPQNIRAFIDAVVRARPQGAKGTYLKKISLASTQGPGVKLDTSGFGGQAQA